jgi:glycerophosphoryl diester phosphodiesterase
MRFILPILAALMPMATAAAGPIIIAHRGASGERPEHTLASYTRAIEQGADLIEPDLVMTRDGILVARHENEISGTTDVADKPEFADRRTSKTIDGVVFDGWFTEDFTLAELKTLRARERLPQLRPGNTAYDGQFDIPTFQEIVDLARRHGVGLYPETKHPSYFQSIGLPMEAALVELLADNGYRTAEDPVFIQSFEAANLRQLRGMTRIRLVQLVAARASHAAMTTPAGLADVATYADAIGPDKALIRPQGGEETTLVADAHAAGLLVHPWTFRSENFFLPPDLRRGDDAAAKGDAAAEYRLFRDAGVDGLFSDFPADAAAALRPAG